MQKSTYLTLFMILLILAACKVKAVENLSTSSETSQKKETVITDSHNSQNSLDWNGTYKGVLPCADCEGIETTITLLKTGKFTKTTVYLGKEDNRFSDNGDFIWNDSGSIITLKGNDGAVQMYQVGENVLFHLDSLGNRIEGNFVSMYQLKKNKMDARIENKKWMLTELMGEEISSKEGIKEAYFVLDSETGKVRGTDSCNRFFGMYEVQEGDRISFGKMAGTLMACHDMTLATSFGQVLQTVDNYSVKDNMLSLNKARMAPLARFKLVAED